MIPEAANQLFEEFCRLPELSWTHSNTGCESRADLMAEIADGRGLKPQKIWIQGPPGPTGYFGIYLNNSKTESALCKYHVAPIIVFDGLGYVFDPGFFKGPVTQKQWVERIANYSVEKGHSYDVQVADWLNFYGPVQMNYDREKALEKRKELLELSKDWSDHTVFHGVMAKARGDWVDELAEQDPEGAQAIQEAGSYSRFANWFMRVQSADDLKKELSFKETYFGIPSEELIDSIDFNNPFASLELRKTHWRYFLKIFHTLQEIKEDILCTERTGDPDKMLFESIFSDPEEEYQRYHKWFMRSSERDWKRFGFDAQKFWADYNSE